MQFGNWKAANALAAAMNAELSALRITAQDAQEIGNFTQMV